MGLSVMTMFSPGNIGHRADQNGCKPFIPHRYTLRCARLLDDMLVPPDLARSLTSPRPVQRFNKCREKNRHRGT